MLKVILLGCLSVAHAAEFQITNNAGGEVWIGILGNSGNPPLNNGGFALGAGQTV